MHVIGMSLVSIKSLTKLRGARASSAVVIDVVIMLISPMIERATQLRHVHVCSIWFAGPAIPRIAEIDGSLQKV